MSIWGVGYGVNPKWKYESDWIFRNGELNAIQFGNLLPGSWSIGSNKELKLFYNIDYSFDEPQSKKYSLLKINGGTRTTNVARINIKIGTTKGGSDLLDITFSENQTREINVADIEIPYYITIKYVKFDSGYSSIKEIWFE